jgi:hypothetical protein
MPSEKFEQEDGTIIEVKSFGQFRCLICGQWHPMEEKHDCTKDNSTTTPKDNS